MSAMKSDPPDLKSIRAFLDLKEEQNLSPVATPNSRAVRRRTEALLTEGYRQAFSVDVDRILHSRSYARYIDKTQVFYLIRNDHITHRVLHVQLVSKIGRSVGRFLGLNEDLIEAIALGHDIGHTPFGHDGERFLSELCREHGIGSFHHNVQSVHFLDCVERKGKGWNLCLQTLDGILCHDGEVHTPELAPCRNKSFADLQAELVAKTSRIGMELIPMTLEGCVVRMVDTVAYIGRDIEDAIRLGLIGRSDLPAASVAVLGDTNGFTDVFRYDRLLHTTERVSLGEWLQQGAHDSLCSTISADGNLVAFYSFADNLVAGDSNGFPDVFVRDFSRPPPDFSFRLPLILK